MDEAILDVPFYSLEVNVSIDLDSAILDGADQPYYLLLALGSSRRSDQAWPILAALRHERSRSAHKDRQCP